MMGDEKISCSRKDWKTFSNFNLCLIHNKKFDIGDLCPDSKERVSDAQTTKESSSQRTSKSQVITSKSQGVSVGRTSKRVYRRKRKLDIFERFHNYGVKFCAVVDWSALFKFEEVHLRNNVSYKRVDLEQVIVRVFRRSILVTLRASAEIRGLPVLDAQKKALAILDDAIAHLPKAIRVSDADVVSVHNAFVNHPTAKVFKEVFNREMVVKNDSGDVELMTDNSEGNHELEYVNKDSAVDKSVDREVYEWDLILKSHYLPSDVKSWVDAHSALFDRVALQIGDVTNNQKVHADNMVAHVGAVRELGVGVRAFTQAINSEIGVLKSSIDVLTSKISGYVLEPMKFSFPISRVRNGLRELHKFRGLR